MNNDFEIAFCETNIRWLLGEEMPNQELIAKHRRQIRMLQEEPLTASFERDDHGFFTDATHDTP